MSQRCKSNLRGKKIRKSGPGFRDTLGLARVLDTQRKLSLALCSWPYRDKSPPAGPSSLLPSNSVATVRLKGVLKVLESDFKALAEEGISQPPPESPSLLTSGWGGVGGPLYLGPRPSTSEQSLQALGLKAGWEDSDANVYSSPFQIKGTGS